MISFVLNHPFLFLFSVFLFCLVTVVLFFWYLSTRPKLNIIWDLDLTLIRSKRMEWDDRLEKEQKVLSFRRSGLYPFSRFYFDHVDDDIIYFRTFVRPFTMFILRLSQLWSRHYVFTSATRGYMENVMEVLDPKKNIFQKEAACTNDFEEKLSRTGKDLRYFKGLDLKRTILLDDRTCYHRSQPENGILVPGYEIEMKYDTILLFYVLPKLIRCSLAKDVRSVVGVDINQKKNKKKKK